MSQGNVEIVRKLFDAYGRGDFAQAMECLAPEVVWQVGQELPARGPQAVLAVWERWDSAWEDLETVPEEFIDADDHVVVTVRYTGRGRGSGVPLDDRLFDVYALRDGLCVAKSEYRGRSEALAAAGLQQG
jgi:ketosteroid isomerase-like protein